MMRRNGAILFALGSAALEMATPQSGIENSWAPPRETLMAGDGANDAQVARGFSPKPTEAPRAVFGRMLMPRDFTMGPATCGFEATAENSFTCITNGATCTGQGGYVGCCQPNSACTAIKTTCLNYSRSSAGACNLPSDFHTLCCATSTLAECYTWVISTTSGTETSIEPFTLFACSATGGRGTLLTRDPAWPDPSSSPTATSTTSATTSSSSTSSPSTSAPSPAKSSTNVGAIAGGTVGGVAAIAILGFVIFYCLRKRPQANGANPANGSAAMTSASPAGPYPPPGQAGYQYGPLPPQPQPNYDGANMSPGNVGGGGYQGAQYGQYPAEVYGYPAPTNSTSPAPTSLYPDAYKPGSTPPQEHQPHQPHQQQQHFHHPDAQELPAVVPIGAETNRAELPSS